MSLLSETSKTFNLGANSNKFPRKEILLWASFRTLRFYGMFGKLLIIDWILFLSKFNSTPCFCPFDFYLMLDGIYSKPYSFISIMANCDFLLSFAELVVFGPWDSLRTLFVPVEGAVASLRGGICSLKLKTFNFVLGICFSSTVLKF